jgi:hypothetical protein
MISCKLCGETIHFDNNIVSERTHKKIPLQEGSDEPHKCAELEALHRKHYSCEDCGVPIYFDDKHISKNDKHIPLSKVTGEPHQCEEAKAADVS